jgi:16S rRNA C1402 N4-methylase RsmH
VYEVNELNAPYWFNNDQVERIQQLNVNYTDEKDMAEIVEVCFRKPNDGEKAKAMNTKQMIELIRKEFPSVKSDQSTKIHLGYAMKDLGFNHTERGHVKFYEVVPLKAA